MTNSQQKQILVIDDDAMNREVMEAFLSSEDYTILLAHNGETGIQLATQALPDAIILDVRMPDMSGYDVCEYLKKQTATQTIPIMIVTGFDSKKDIEQGQAVGADQFLSRPFDGDDLLQRVRHMVTG